MENTVLKKEIELAFADLVQKDRDLKECVYRICRLINRLQSADKETSLHLKKIAADVMSAYTNQLRYSELKNKSENPGLKVKPEFDKSFFDSMGILKAELYGLLEKI